MAGCRNLRTLLASSNRLAGPGALADLADCSTLMTLDLQDNQLSDKQVQRPHEAWAYLVNIDL